MNSVIIATLKAESELGDLLAEIRDKSVMEHEVIVSSSENSVAYNSNRALEKAKGDIILKVDDDIFNITPGWDKVFVDMLNQEKDIVMVSARVFNVDGTVQLTCSNSVDLTPDVVEPPSGLVPYCCVAFRNDGLRFDENFKGSSFDDTDFTLQLRMKYPGSRVVINNTVTINHRLESKGCLFGLNQEYFTNKWKGIAMPDGSVPVK
jgi:hypothetical protein